MAQMVALDNIYVDPLYSYSGDVLRSTTLYTIALLTAKVMKKEEDRLLRRLAEELSQRPAPWQLRISARECGQEKEYHYIHWHG